MAQAAHALAAHPLHRITQLVSQAHSLQDIYEAALSCLRDALDIEKSSILLFDDQGIMRFVAWRNLSPEYRAAVDGHSPWKATDVEPEPVLVADVALEPSLAVLSSAIEQEGIRSLAFIPLTLGGKLLGKFMLYRAHAGAFTNEH